MTATSAIPPVDTYKPGIVTKAPEGALGGAAKMLLAIGVLAYAASFVGLFTGGHDDHGKQFYFSYLTSYMFTLSLALGALFFVIVQHVARAGWSIVVRRIAENMTTALPVLALMVIPIILGSHTLYHHWMGAELDPSKPAYDALVAGKSGYLNTTFFYIRMGFYFVTWLVLARWFRNKSIEQDGNGNPELSLKMAYRGAPALIFFGITITFAAFDWMMSLNPHWFSTMYGVTYFAGSEMSFLALLGLMCLWLSKKGLLKDVINTEHYHDIGKLMFAFMVFWAYVNFSQFFLIHYADIPEETSWFHDRSHGGWETVFAILCVGHFLLPFAFLMSRHIKRSKVGLTLAALLLLVMHWMDMHYQVMPNAHLHEGHFGLHWLDFTTLIGMFCIFLGLTIRSMGTADLIPVRDPKLRESLKFHNILVRS